MQSNEWLTTEEHLFVWVLLHSRNCIENKLFTRWCWIFPCNCLICLGCYYTVQWYRSWCIVSFPLLTFILCSLHLLQFNSQATQPPGSFCTYSSCIGDSKCCGPISDFHGEPSYVRGTWAEDIQMERLSCRWNRSGVKNHFKIVPTFIVNLKNNEFFLVFSLIRTVPSWKWLLLLTLRLPLGTIGLIIDPVANLILGLMWPQPCKQLN